MTLLPLLRAFAQCGVSPGQPACRRPPLVACEVRCPCGRRAAHPAVPEGTAAPPLACDAGCERAARQAQLASAFGIERPAEHVPWVDRTRRAPAHPGHLGFFFQHCGWCRAGRCAAHHAAYWVATLRYLTCPPRLRRAAQQQHDAHSQRGASVLHPPAAAALWPGAVGSFWAGRVSCPAAQGGGLPARAGALRLPQPGVAGGGGARARNPAGRPRRQARRARRDAGARAPRRAPAGRGVRPHHRQRGRRARPPRRGVQGAPPRSARRRALLLLVRSAGLRAPLWLVLVQQPTPAVGGTIR